MPKKGENILKFKDYHKQLNVPFVIYADFESLLVPIQSVSNNDKFSYTEKLQSHQGCGYAYKLVCCYDDKFSKPLKIVSWRK